MEDVMIFCIRFGVPYSSDKPFVGRWEEHDPGGWKIDYGPVICSRPTQTGTWLIILHQPEKVLD